MRKSLVTVYGSRFTPFSLPRQRDDGVEARRLERGIDAREHADTAGDGDRQHDVDERHRHRVAEGGGDYPRQDDGQQEAEDAAARGQERRLDQELQEHLLARRAQSFAQADLEGALGDGDEHDVHHDDAADKERDGRDGNDHSRDAARQRVNLARDLARVDQAEVVLLAALQLMLIAERQARVLNRRVELLARGGLAVNLYALAAPEDFAVGRERNVHVLVERLAEHRAALLLDADHRHRQPAHADGLADGVLAGEELLLHVVAYDGDHRRRVVLLLKEEAPLVNRLVFDGLHVRRATLYLHAEQLLAILLEVSLVHELRPDLGAGRAVLVHPVVVVEV